MDLKFFLTENLFESTQRFFTELLNINVAPANKNELNIAEFLKEQLTDQKLLSNIKEARFVGMINNLSLNGKNVKEVENILSKSREDYDMILVFGLKVNSSQLSKTDITRLTRAINRRSANRPVVLLIKYGNFLSFSAAERENYQNPSRQGEKVGRISILKDLNLKHIHAGHERIINQLRIERSISSFREMNDQWHKVFDLKILNQEFYKRISAWYSNALCEVKFPYHYYSGLPENKGKKPNELQEIANQIACIRLLTRTIFVWFMKQKKRGDKSLIPDYLFEKKILDEILNYTDKYQSTYYKAILQNLFFATFNTSIDSELRAISHKNYNDHRMPRFRYLNYFKNPIKNINELFSDIPFLNGGLFENLDIDHNTRIDWFSDPDLSKPGTIENALIVPDYIFFGNNKNEGLYEIFNNYYFTIEENTPLNQEIALDPELLGKIFENLLAAYLPESKQSARKRTGSYYTPREIVNYIVDESLIEYLQIKIDKPVPNKKLRALFSYEDEENPFKNEEETTNCIIKFLSESKILDPACGSGAFPMGMLHQIVHALGKLDPGNIKWENEQIELLVKPKINDLIIVQKLSSERARKEAERQLKSEIEEIKETFRKNDPDYTRKLYLIQNCIFGVDIQPIAIHISKLRFFISLMVDQKINEKDRHGNYGIKPLPNLETKFVAANTLRQLLAPSARSEDIIKIEQKIKDLRKSFFYTRNRQEKVALEKEDETLRDELQKHVADLFKKDNREFQSQIENHTAKLDLLKNELSKSKVNEKQKNAIQKEIKLLHKKLELLEQKILDNKQVDTISEQVAHWNPYNQNDHAEWFDPEWMFGFNSHSGVFDIVIGNPPYGGFKLEEDLCYSLGLESKDPYGAFIARFLGSGARQTPLKKDGILSYIVSDTFMTIKSHFPLRKQMVDNYIHKIIRVHPDTFGATVNTAIIICRRNEFEMDDKGQLFKCFNDLHNCHMADLTNISFHEDYSRFIQILNSMTEFKTHKTTDYAFYEYPQNNITKHKNLPFFITQPNILLKFIKDTLPLNNYIEEICGGIKSYDDKSYIRNIHGNMGYLTVESKNIVDRKLTQIEKQYGINVKDFSREKYFIRYEKGGETINEYTGILNHYYKPVEFYFSWDRNTVRVVGQNNGLRNKHRYFAEGIGVSTVGVYAPIFRFCEYDVFFNNYNIIFLKDINDTFFLLPILCSKAFRFFLEHFENHTVAKNQVDLLNVPIPKNYNKLELLNTLTIEIIRKLKADNNYDYASNEQLKIDKHVFEAYGLDKKDIDEIESWYARRYPKLSAAQKENMRKLGKSTDFLEIYGFN